MIKCISLDIMFVAFVHHVLNHIWQVSMHTAKTGSGREVGMLLLIQSTNFLES